MPRLEIKKTYMKVAYQFAELSYANRRKVGCIIVKDKRIIAQGYNGFLPGCPHESIVRNNHEQATVHAEINAICDCANRGVSVNNATIYISHYPCINCCKAILASGISKIFYLDDYKNDPIVKRLILQKNIEIKKI